VELVVVVGLSGLDDWLHPQSNPAAKPKEIDNKAVLIFDFCGGDVS
jgi:hypothetical protein